MCGERKSVRKSGPQEVGSLRKGERRKLARRRPAMALVIFCVDDSLKRHVPGDAGIALRLELLFGPAS